MKTTFYFLFALLYHLSAFCSFAQGNEKPFVVSPLIGDTLSLEERDYYNLLPTIQNFQWAVFFLNPDSTLNVKVTHLRNFVKQDTIINNYRSLRSLVLHLNAVENPESVNPIKNEDYTGNEVSVVYNEGKIASGNLLSATANSLIVYSLDCDEEQIDINCVMLLRPSDIEKLKVKSDFNLGMLLYPTITGLAAIIIYNSTLTPDDKNLDNMMNNFLTGLAVGIGGSLVGFGLSYAIPLKISSEEEYSLPLNEDDIEGLSRIARYKDFEPFYRQQSK
ncbi:MAG: hypothetical protein IPM14_04585 [bacterium]|nr:hypothetical protein [bacterium]